MNPPNVFKIKCVDEFYLEIRVGEAYYCQPQSHKGPWDSAEVAVTAGSCDFFLDEFRTHETYEYSFYPYVPAQTIILL